MPGLSLAVWREEELFFGSIHSPALSLPTGQVRAGSELPSNVCDAVL